MSDQPNVLYTAEASVTGGREGHARTSDGRLDVELDVPREMGGTGGRGQTPSNCSPPATPRAFSRRCSESPPDASST